MKPCLVAIEWERGKKSWVAVIKGRSRKWGLEREFVSAIEGRRGQDKGVLEYALEEGCIYEFCEKGERRFGVVRDGEVVPIDGKQEVLEAISRAFDAIDGVIRRINGEGAFSDN